MPSASSKDGVGLGDVAPGSGSSTGMAPTGFLARNSGIGAIAWKIATARARTADRGAAAGCRILKPFCDGGSVTVSSMRAPFCSVFYGGAQFAHNRSVRTPKLAHEPEYSTWTPANLPAKRNGFQEHVTRTRAARFRRAWPLSLVRLERLPYSARTVLARCAKQLTDVVSMSVLSPCAVRRAGCSAARYADPLSDFRIAARGV